MYDISAIDPNFKVDTQLNEKDIRFYDVNWAPFRVYGVYYEDGMFRRMPERVAKSVSQGVYALHANTSGGRVRFSTDSAYVAIQAKMSAICRSPHFSLTGAASFDLYVYDGTEKYIQTFEPPYDIQEGYEKMIRFPDRRVREITIHFPLYSNVEALYIGLQESASVGEGRPYVNEKPVVYYGSSITQGGCASRPGCCYHNILSRRLNMDHVNLGFSGNARGEEAIAEYISKLDMSAFVLDYDHNASSPDYLTQTHEPFFKKVRQAHPQLPIILMSRPKFYPTEGEQKRLEVIKTTYRNAVESGDRNVYFLDGKALMARAGDEGTVDGCHPTDLGFMSMASALESILKTLI